jgi:8-oxo-dGTP pyrophosphatase MutT (NUDIX family)
VHDDLVLSARDRHGWTAPDAEQRLPAWLQPVVHAARTVRADELSVFLPPPVGGRAGSVLMLFGHGEHGPDILIIERASDLRQHAGQPAFPGGAVDPDDADGVAAALREAAEETGVRSQDVVVFGALPAIWVPPSGFVVTPVLAWWRSPGPVSVRDPGEVAAVHRVPWAELLDPARRVQVRHPSGYVGPGFEVRGMLVWGFTGGLISRLFAKAGLERPWTPDRVRDVEARA